MSRSEPPGGVRRLTLMSTTLPADAPRPTTGLPPQYVPAAGGWRAAAYDARGGGTDARLSATGATEEEAVSRLASLIVARRA